MQKITFQKIIKTIISSSTSDEHSVEISSQAIENGFLKLFPGPGLAIFIYLITNCDEKGYLETNPTIISSYLPDDYELTDINETLKFFEKNDIIEFPPLRQGDYTYRLKLNFDKIEGFLNRGFIPSQPDNIRSTGKKNTYYNKTELRNLVLKNTAPTQQELYQALLTFVPPDDNLEAPLEEIEKWLETFEPELLQELIRRVVKWIEKYDNPPEKAFHYLKGILDDWYQKEIFDYKRLQHFDRLYRETRELASAYGINDWQNVKPVHMEIFLSWLTEGYPLSTALVKYAIKEAFRRKSDGHPSLKYIEDNFIIPWKEARIKTINEARAFLKGNNKTTVKSSRSNKPGSERKKRKNSLSEENAPLKEQEGKLSKANRQEWEELHWDFEDFK